MKKLTTLVFAGLIAATLSMPAWAQNTGSTNQSKAAAKKDTKEDKKSKKAAKAKKQASKDAKKSDKK
jgi:hypothetical protein